MKAESAMSLSQHAEGARIDVDKLVQLHALLGDAFGPLVASFISNAALYVSQIEQAVEAMDPKQAAAIAHKLKSSAAQLGLPDLAKAAERVEKLDAAEHLAALKGAQESVCGVLRTTAEAIRTGEVTQ